MNLLTPNPLPSPTAAAVTTDLRAGAARDEWWRGAVIYQIYPRSFFDSNGDGIGDLAGIADKLDHIANLGVDGVWLSPFFTSPMRDFGYDVADYCDVDPIFGTLADFDRVVARAHELGLRLIIDQVYSHSSDRHAWFRESRSDRINPRANWYVWADPRPDGAPPNNWQSVFGGPAWTWDSRRKQYYFHNFLASQPDLNLHNPDVQAALLEVARFWLDRGVDGFRLDAINFGMHDRLFRDNPPAPADGRRITRPYDMQLHVHSMSQPEMVGFLERIRALGDSLGGRFTVAEIGGPRPIDEMKAYTRGQTRLNTAYGFHFLYAGAITSRLTQEALGPWTDAAEGGWPAWAFSNHDAPRCVSRWAAEPDRDRAARVYLLLLAALRGNVFLYQGEELGLPQAAIGFEDLQDPEAIANWPETLGRDGARTPMPWRSDAPNAGFSTAKPWLPVDPRHYALAVEAQAGDPASILCFTRALLAFRRAHPVLRSGVIEFLPTAEPLCAFIRSEDGGVRLLCVVNLGPDSVDWRAQLATADPALAAGEPLFSTAAGASTDAPADDLPGYGGFVMRLGAGPASAAT